MRIPRSPVPRTDGSWLFPTVLFFLLLAPVCAGAAAETPSEDDPAAGAAPWGQAKLTVATREVPPFAFRGEDHGIALPQGSPAREPINEALLRIIRSDGWQGELQGSLGRGH